MRKTIKAKPANSGDFELYSTTDSTEPDDKSAYMIHNLDDIQKETDDRTNRVNDIINKMSAVSVENDGAKLADFNPPANPVVQVKKEFQMPIAADPQIPDLANPLQMPSPAFSNKSVNPYIVNNANIALGNYQQVYRPPAQISHNPNKPYYAAMGLTGGSDSKVLEKINYMIHLLENIENEKTANITEEFVLYTFLGVFVIFVLDSFTRTGKYIR